MSPTDVRMDARAAPSRRELLLGGVMLATAGVTFARLPRHKIVALPDGDLAAAVPERAGQWQYTDDSGFILPPQDELAAAAVYDEQLARGYANGVDPLVMLLIAYDRMQSGMLQIHRPESCYPGSGFTISRTVETVTPLGQGVAAQSNFLTAERGERIEQVLYWTRLGNAFPRTWHTQRSAIARQNLAGVVPDGALVRISVVTADRDRALRVLNRFAATLYAASGAKGKALLGGPASAGAAASA